MYVKPIQRIIIPPTRLHSAPRRFNYIPSPGLSEHASLKINYTVQLCHHQPYSTTSIKPPHSSISTKMDPDSSPTTPPPSPPIWRWVIGFLMVGMCWGLVSFPPKKQNQINPPSQKKNKFPNNPTPLLFPIFSNRQPPLCAKPQSFETLKNPNNRTSPIRIQTTTRIYPLGQKENF